MEQITLILVDKGYYDYDYKEVEKKEKRDLATVESTRKSDKEVRNILGAFGWGRAKAETEYDAKALQEIVIRDINERANAQK